MIVESYKKWLILKKILSLKIKREIYIGELAKLIKISQGHPYFQDVLQLATLNDAIVHTKKIGTAQFIEINNKKLLNLVWNSVFIDNVIDVIKIKNPYWYNI